MCGISIYVTMNLLPFHWELGDYTSREGVVVGIWTRLAGKD